MVNERGVAGGVGRNRAEELKEEDS